MQFLNLENKNNDTEKIYDAVNRYQSCAELKNDLNNYQNMPPKQRLFSKLFNK